MTTTINNEHNKFNFSSEREQSQACLDSAEREKNQGRKVLNVPNLRFPEFQGEWEEERLADIADLYKGTGISKDQLSDDGEPCILYGELYTKYKSETIREVISKTNIDNTKLVRSKANDVIIPCSGETAEDIATARCVLNSNILLGGDLNIIRLHGYDGAFMSYQLNGRRKYDIAKVAQGVSVVHLYSEHLKGVKTINPCLEEQKKIASLLALFDERITTQNKIIDKLQSLIKGIRLLVFSNVKDGTESTLGQYLVEYNERNVDCCLKPVSIGRYGIRLRDEIYSKELSDDYSKNKVIRKNTLTIGMGSKQIDIGILLDDNVYCVSPAYSTFKIVGVLTEYFKEYIIYLNSLLSNLYMITGARQGKSVNKEGLLRHKIIICSYEKQQQIAKIFRLLNNQLSVEKEFLNTLIKQKQYLLRQMFI